MKPNDPIDTAKNDALNSFSDFVSYNIVPACQPNGPHIREENTNSRSD